MSIEAINWAVKISGTPTQKHVLLILANHTNEFGIAFPSNVLIAAETGLNEKSVRRAKIALVEAGLMVPYPPKGKNAFQLSLSKDAENVDPVPYKRNTKSRIKDNKAQQKDMDSASHDADFKAQSWDAKSAPYNHHITTNKPPYPSGQSSLDADASKGGEVIPFSAVGARAPARQAERGLAHSQGPSARAELFGRGLGIVRSLTGKPDRAARGLIGKWAKVARDDIATLNAILAEAADMRPIDPIAWIEKAVQHRFSGGWSQIDRDFGIDGRQSLDELAALVGDR